MAQEETTRKKKKKRKQEVQAKLPVEENLRTVEPVNWMANEDRREELRTSC